MKLFLLFIFSVFSLCELQAQIPTSGLIKDYKFTNGTLTSDVSPLLNAGTTTLVPTGTARAVITDRNAETNKAISLNGDSFLAGGTNATSVNNYSISFWVKTTTNESLKRYIFDQHNTAANPAGFSASLKDGKIYFNGQCSWSSASISGNSGVRQVISPVISDGQWHHIVCLVSSTRSSSYAGSFTSYIATYTYSMYVDNVFVGSDSETDNFAMLTSESHTIRGITPTKQLVIGKSPDISFLDYQDSIDQIRYYERTLVASEIEQLYIEDKPLSPIYVNSNATGSNNGTSWADAYTNLQTAIDAAVVSINEIWVAAGTYKPSGATRTSTFLMKNALKMYGGFNGTETLITQRNPKTNITILSGDINGNDNATVLDSELTRQDNTYHVITLKGNIRDVLIDGFTISGGNANGGTLTTGTASAQYYHTRGGAIYVNTYAPNDFGSIALKNCILEKNSGSDTAVAAGYFAGGVSNMSYRTDFESCIIRNNFSAANSQILISGATGFGWVGNGKIENCLFYNNISASGASCLYISASTTSGGTQLGIRADIINTTFANNTSQNSPGSTIRVHNATNSFFRNCIVYNNGGVTPFLISGTLGNPIVSTSILQGGQFSALTSNPLLNPDFTLPATSPALNIGDNSYISSGVSTDLAGNGRIVNTTVDLGAYEYDAALSNTDFSTTKAFTVYPNPTDGDINIQSTEEIAKVILYSLDGRILLETQNTFLQIQDLPSGVYVLSLENNFGKKATHKIIKK